MGFSDVCLGWANCIFGSSARAIVKYQIGIPEADTFNVTSQVTLAGRPSASVSYLVVIIVIANHPSPHFSPHTGTGSDDTWSDSVFCVTTSRGGREVRQSTRCFADRYSLATLWQVVVYKATIIFGRRLDATSSKLLMASKQARDILNQIYNQIKLLVMLATNARLSPFDIKDRPENHFIVYACLFTLGTHSVLVILSVLFLSSTLSRFVRFPEP